MKKLFEFGTVLSRDQMKNITGGVTCVWTNASGHQSVGSCSADANTCQNFADGVCAASDHCSDVNCE